MEGCDVPSHCATRLSLRWHVGPGRQWPQGGGGTRELVLLVLGKSYRMTPIGGWTEKSLVSRRLYTRDQVSDGSDKS